MPRLGSPAVKSSSLLLFVHALSLGMVTLFRMKIVERSEYNKLSERGELSSLLMRDVVSITRHFGRIFLLIFLF